MSSKEAEFLRDGFNTEKSCTCAKQSPIVADLSKSVNPSGVEADTPSSSNAPSSSGHESQPMMDSDVVPSSGSSRNLLFRIGIIGLLFLSPSYIYLIVLFSFLEF